jgi:ABC-2 type transport system ATP-binding protein
MVGSRTIEATLPGADADVLAAVTGVTGVTVRGDVVTLTCTDSDAALRALLPAHPDMHAIEIRGAGLEEAFLELTTDPAEKGEGS